MKCPHCIEVDLLMSERLGIEIDYCPKCRGVWLDKGELDKFIQQSERQTGEYNSSQSRTDNQYDGQWRDDDDDDRRYSQRGKKKESFLSRLFDFD